LIVIDSREALEHPEISTLLKVPYRVERMDSSDYSFLDRANNPVGIERAEIADLIGKIRSGRLEAQLTRMDEAYSSVILMVEGVYDQMGGLLTHYKKSREGKSYYRTRIESYTRYNDILACMVRLSELGIEILQTPNFEASMLLVETIYKNRTKPEEAHTMFRKIRKVVIPVKASSNPAVPMLLALCPRMTEKGAINLIYKYNTIWNVLNQTDKDLIEVEGFGKQGLNNLKRGIGKV